MRKRRTLLGVVGAAGVAVMLTGCGNIDAGSAARDLFIEHMAGTPGVLGASGAMSNNLPFHGSGDLVVELDAQSDAEVLDAALGHAQEFQVPGGVSVDRLVVRLPGAIDADGADSANSARITIEMLWSGDTGGIAERALALSAVDGLRSYAEEQENVFSDNPTVTTRVVVATMVDPCPVLDVVETIPGVDHAGLEEFEQATGDTLTRLVRSNVCNAAL